MDPNFQSDSNHVPIHRVLDSIRTSPDLIRRPILYFPEYAFRRITAAYETAGDVPFLWSSDRPHVKELRTLYDQLLHLLVLQNSSSPKKRKASMRGLSCLPKSSMSGCMNERSQTDEDDTVRLIRSYLAMTIVIPSSDTLIQQVARRRDIDLQQRQESLDEKRQELRSGILVSKENFVGADHLETDATFAGEKETVPAHFIFKKRKYHELQVQVSSSEHVKDGNELLNIYKKRKRSQVSKSFQEEKAIVQSSHPILLSRSESLPSIVDGAIFTLVQRREQQRQRWRIAQQRQRVPNAAATACRRSTMKQRQKDNNEFRHGRNMLSEGYDLSPNNHTSAANAVKNNTTDPKNTTSKGRIYTSSHCTNMAPGIFCRHINSCASYARSAPIMHLMHAILGDDLLRELLLHTIMLIPCFAMDDVLIRPEYVSQDGSTSQDHLKQGYPHLIQDYVNINQNYYQLCGEPLFFAKKSCKGQENVSKNGKLYQKDHRIMGSKGNTLRPTKPSILPSPSISIGANQQPSSLSKEMKRKRNCTLDSIFSKGDPHELIPRRKIFYSETFTPKVGLPSSHVMNKIRVDATSITKSNANKTTSLEEQLLENMLEIPLTKKTRRGKKRRRDIIRSHGILLCRQILKRHSQCDYTRLLERYCPLPSTSWKSERSITTLISYTISTTGVVSFLKAVLCKVFPLLFWGSERNRQIFFRTLTTFLNLRRKETFPIKCIMQGIRITEFQWLYFLGDKKLNTKELKAKKYALSKSVHDSATTVVRSLLKWMYCYFIIPLLKATFYITETEFAGHRVFYYRKPIWSRVRSLSIDTVLGDQYVKLSHTEAQTRISSQCMGTSRLRLLPKRTGIRPIVSLDKSYDIVMFPNESFRSNCLPSKRKISTNGILRHVFEVLKYEYENNPRRVGYAVGYNDIYPRIINFIDEMKNSRKGFVIDNSKDGLKSNDNFFFASVDIHKCFDNINQDMMYEILLGIIGTEEYVLQKYVAIHPCGTKRQVHFKTHVATPANISAFNQVAARNISSRHSRSILIDGVNCSVAKKKDILALLHEHLFHHTVVAHDNFGPQLLAQRKGIAQGSVLSTLLCNFYYGYCDSILMDGVFDCSDHASSTHFHIILRVVDDFMLISTDRDTSIRFLQKMQTGLPHLGVTLNDQKSYCSFDLNYPSKVANKKVVQDRNGDFYFSWCGLLFNTRTCAVHIDYHRSTGSNIKDSLTIDRCGNEGIRLVDRMRSFIRPRCIPILYDLRINSRYDVYFNFCQAILFCAMKTIDYVRVGMNGGIDQNPKFIFNAIENVICFAYNLIKSRLPAAVVSGKMRRRPAPSIAFVQIFHVDQATWVGFHLFLSIFEQQPFARSSPLIRMLRSSCRKLNASYQNELTFAANEALMNLSTLTLVTNSNS